MKRKAVCIGIDRYDDRGIAPLRCAARDAREMAAVLRHGLGFDAVEVLTHIELEDQRPLRVVRRLGADLAEGDVFLFFFAGHGKTTDDDQLLVLPDASRRALESGIASGEGVLSCKALKAETDGWAGVQRAFIIDACRVPLPTEQANNRDGASLARFKGGVIYRDMALDRGDTQSAPFVVLNSCEDGERAEELIAYQGGHGLFTAALLATFEEGARARQSLTLDAKLADSLATRMQQFARQYGDRDTHQRPLFAGKHSVPLFAAEAAQALRQREMLAEFEVQFSTGCFERPVGDCCRDTLAALRGMGVDRTTLTALAERLQVALEEQKELQRQEAETKWKRREEESHRNDPRNFNPCRAGESVPKLCAEAPEMVAIPPGVFLMGSPEIEPKREKSEGPQHEVQIGYWLAVSKYAVTFDEWDRFAVETNGYRPSDGVKIIISLGSWGRGNRPVINVSWQDAQRYLKWLNGKVGLSESSPNRYRLLSEAEWEYACRAGSTTAFSWGDSITTNQANYRCYNGRGKTVPVDSFQPNPWGLYQMHGNVEEWVEDVWHLNYNGAPQNGSAWVTGWGWRGRVLRGGSWGEYPEYLRSAHRNIDSPTFGTGAIGFRIARTLP